MTSARICYRGPAEALALALPNLTTSIPGISRVMLHVSPLAFKRLAFLQGVAIRSFQSGPPVCPLATTEQPTIWISQFLSQEFFTADGDSRPAVRNLGSSSSFASKASAVERTKRSAGAAQRSQAAAPRNYDNDYDMILPGLVAQSRSLSSSLEEYQR